MCIRDSPYGLLGIGKGDKGAMHAQHQRNFRFFDAPVGLMFTLDRVMGQGSLVDYGMFLQNIMLAARARGLHTCPQAAWNDYATLDRAALGDCQQIVGTSTMLLNDTLDAMLAACGAAREFALIGPSAGLWPDALFARGVTRLCGTQVIDGQALADAIASGQGWGASVRKFAIGREEWLGWKNLLAG